jgi:O-antigen/teichoic acid export membrane protein
VAAYLKRLASSLGAYQLASVVSMALAVLLLPVYTRYIATTGYGIVETLATAVILVSIVVRLGIVEAFLRYYYSDEDPARRDALARRTAGFLLVSTTIAAIPLAVEAGPLSKLVLTRRESADFQIAVLGLWAFTNLELAYGLLRVDERLREYAVASVANVGLTVAASLALVVGARLRERGLLLGNYGATAVILVAVWWRLRDRLLPRRGHAEPLSLLLRFGLPTVPAEASVYALSVIDRNYLVHSRGLGAAGLYSIAVKFASAIGLIVRAFQYAWPPLAYSVADDAQARRLYGLVTTYYVLFSGWLIAGLTLESRWLLRLLTTPRYYDAYRAIPWVTLGWAMYGLWVVFLVIAGRARVTTRNFAAALCGVAVNIAMLFALVGPLGIAGAGIALCGAYLAMLAAMYLLTRRLFEVQFEWRRLAQVVVVIGGASVAGDLLLPVGGTAGVGGRIALFLAIPGALYASGFAHRRELEQARALLARAGARRMASRGCS